MPTVPTSTVVDNRRPAPSKASGGGARVGKAPGKAPAVEPFAALVAALAALVAAHKATATEGAALALLTTLEAMVKMAQRALASPGSSLLFAGLGDSPERETTGCMLVRQKPRTAPPPVAPPAPPSPPGSLFALESVLGSLAKVVRELQTPAKATDPKTRAKHHAEQLARLADHLDQARAELAPALTLPTAPPALGATGTALAWDALLQRIVELSWLASGASLPPGFLPLAAHLDNIHTVLRRHRYTGAELATGPEGELIARLRPAS